MWNDPETDSLVTWIFLVGAVLVGGPSVLTVLGVDAGTWLLAHGVLVPPAESMVELPLVGAGLDLRRLFIVGIVAVLGLIVAITRLARARR